MKNNKKILIVDDNIDIVNFLSNFLERFNIKVIKAKNANEALEFFSLNRPEIVLLDIQMPDRDGISVLKEILDISPKTKVFMLTAKSEEFLQKEAKEIGAIDYIIKPIDLAVLVKKIRRYIDI